jgi:hypothetical protein
VSGLRALKSSAVNAAAPTRPSAEDMPPGAVRRAGAGEHARAARQTAAAHSLRLAASQTMLTIFISRAMATQ